MAHETIGHPKRQEISPSNTIDFQRNQGVQMDLDEFDPVIIKINGRLADSVERVRIFNVKKIIHTHYGWLKMRNAAVQYKALH